MFKGFGSRDAEDFAIELAEEFLQRCPPSTADRPTIGLARFQRGPGAAVTRATYGAGTNFRGWGGRLSVNGSVALSRYARSRSWTGTLSSRLQVTPQDDLLVQLQFNRFHDMAIADSRYREQVMRVQWVRRF